MNERIKQIRLHLGLNQTELGKRLGVTNGAVSKVEAGDNSVSSQFLSALLREFNINKEWLETGKGEMFAETTLAKRAKKAVSTRLTTDNEFILKTFAALGEMSVEDWAVIEKFIDKLKGE